MLDLATAYKRYQFIGHEFLTWLWFVVENKPQLPAGHIDAFISLDIGNRIVLEHIRERLRDTITIKGQHPDQAAGKLSLKNGAHICELHLMLKADHREWQFTIKGDQLCLAGLKTESAGPVDAGEAPESALLDKAYNLSDLLDFIDGLFDHFLQLRASDDWQRRVLPEMRSWLQA